MSEWYIKEEAGLISQDEWTGRIANIKDGCVGQLDIRALHEALDAAFEKRKEDREVAVLFSGGVDSTYIAYMLDKIHVPFTCYTVGFHDEGQKMPDDVEWAKGVAKHFGWKIRVIMLDFDDMEDVLAKTVGILGERADVVNVGVGAVEVAAYEAITKDGLRIVFGGLGSEEIFAGYQRHDDAQDAHAECWKGLSAMFARDMLREYAVASHYALEGKTPFLDDDLIRVAMQIPIKDKIEKGGKKKIALRRIAEEIGIPREYAWRKKQAAQYGSRTDKAIMKLAQKEGLSKADYISHLKRFKKQGKGEHT